MSPSSDDLPGDRAKRVKAIRTALGLNQPAFAELLNDAARKAGLPAIYHNTKVSKMEIEGRKVSLDDAIVVAAVDPEQRGVYWLAGVRKLKSHRVHSTVPSSRDEGA